MEVHVTSEVQAQLDQLASATGKTRDAIVNDVLSSYLSELLETRQLLNSRYDDLKSGRIQGIDGESARRMLLEKNNARRQQPE